MAQSEAKGGDKLSPTLSDLFTALPLDKQKQALADLQAIYADKVQAKRQELLAQLELLGGIPDLPKVPRVRAVQNDGDGVRKRASPRVTHRGPNGEEWRSRGQKPRWLTDMLAKGHSEAEFRVTE